MARVNVEQRALTDSRMVRLGRNLAGAKLPTHLARSLGIGWMAFVWNECQERGSCFLDRDTLETACGEFADAGQMLVELELAEEVDPGVFRIRGTTQKNVGWLADLRDRAGKGGRKRAENLTKEQRSEIARNAANARYSNKTAKPELSNPACQLLSEPACAPAPAPALEAKSKEGTPLVPLAGGNEKKKRPPKSELPDDWEPSFELLKWAADNHPRVNVLQETLKFKRHHIGKRTKWSNWDLSWQNWISAKFVDNGGISGNGYESAAERKDRKFAESLVAGRAGSPGAPTRIGSGGTRQLAIGSDDAALGAGHPRNP